MRKYLETIRLTVLRLVFTLLVFLPMTSLYVNSTAAYAVHHLEGFDRVAHDVIEMLAGRHVSDLATFDGFKGTTWSSTVFGYRVSDPLAVLAQAAARLGFSGPLLAAAVIPVLASLLLGRVFCGWLCPAGFLFEMIERLRNLLERMGVPVLDLHLDTRLKYGVLFLFLAVSAASGTVAISVIYPPVILGRELSYLIVGGAFGAGAGVLAATALFDLAVARRGFCRTLCPGGALYALLGRFRLLRVRRAATDCIDCGACTRQCSFGLDPMRDGIGQDCTNCGACVAICPTRALTMSPLRIASRAKVAVLAVIVLGTLSAPAAAHHVLGRPSYALSGHGNTPSSSQMETQIGDYFVSMMTYPAFLEPGQTGRVKFYALQIDTGERLTAPVRFVIGDDSWLGGHEEILGVQSPADNVYSQDFQFRKAGNYVISAVFEADGAPYRVDFPVRVGSPVPWNALAAIAGAVAATLAGAAIVRRRRTSAKQ